MVSTNLAESQDNNEALRRALREFAEDRAVAGDEESLMAALQLASRLDELAGIRPPLEDDHPAVRQLRLVEILYILHVESPRPATFTTTWLHRTLAALCPSSTGSRHEIQAEIESLVEAKAVAAEPPTISGDTGSFVVISDRPLLDVIERHTHEFAKRRVPVMPVTMRCMLQLYADAATALGRTDDAALMIETAGYLWNPDPTLPPPNPVLPIIARVLEGDTIPGNPDLWVPTGLAPEPEPPQTPQPRQ